MAETFVTVYQGNGGRIDLGYEYSQDYATNKTSLTVKTYVVKTNSSYYSYRSSPQTLTLTVNRVATAYGWTFNFSYMTLNARYLITTAVRELAHNPDGTCGNILASVYCATGTDGLGTINGSYSIPIATIPRTSIPTLSVSSQAIGSVITIYTNKQANFTHKISYAFGSESSELIANAVDSYAWTLPSSLANQIPNTTSGVGTITVKTYSGSTYIGERSLNFTATVPDTTSFQPTATGLTASIFGTGRDKTIAKYVQSISKVVSSFVATAQGGANISSSSINIKRQSDNGNSMTISGTSGTSDILTLSGIYVINATTTDSRGRSKTATMTIIVEAYAVPKITSYTANRQASAKTSVDTARNGTYTYMAGSNLLTVIVARAPRGGAFTNLNSTAGTTSGTFTGTYVSNGNTETSSYDFRLTISDSFGNSAIATITVSTSSVALSIKGDVGIGVGKVWEQGALDIAGDIFKNGSPIQGLRLTADTGYPVSYATDVNSIIDTGFHSISNPTNAPPGMTYGTLLVLRRSTADVIQIANGTNQSMWYRNSSDSGNTWNPWTQVAKAENAIIESGSNTNGSYVKFGDGTMICWATSYTSLAVNTAKGAVYQSADIGWTYPAAFYAAPSVNTQVMATSSLGVFWNSTKAIYSSNVINVIVSSASFAAFSQSHSRFAIGRWKA